jgi:hypothetical protein
VFLVGLGGGAGLGLRFAPKSGEQVRGNIADAVNRGVDGMMARGEKLGRRTQNTLEQARAHLREVAEDVPGRA